MQQFRTKVMGIALAVAVQALCTWAPLCPGQAEARPQTESDTPGASIAEIAVKVVPASEREVWMNALLGLVELDRVGRGVVEGCPQWGVAYPDGSDHVWTYLNHPEGGSTWLFGLYMKTAQAEAFVETLDGLLEPLGTTRVPPRLDVAFDMQGQHILEKIGQKSGQIVEQRIDIGARRAGLVVLQQGVIERAIERIAPCRTDSPG